MEDLQQFYRSAVGDQVAALERAIILFESGVANAEETIRQLAHTLKGSGSSYGFPEVSHAANLVERATVDQLAVSGWQLVDILNSITAGAESNTILVVEDDPLISHFIQAELSGDQHRIVQCASLADANRFLDASPAPALILLDLFLPDGDGRSLLHDLRRSDATAEVPIIVMSAAASDTRHREVESLAATGFISKPFQPGELRSLLADILGSDDTRLISSRVDLTDSYRSLFQRGVAVTVAAVVLDDQSADPAESLIPTLAEHLGGDAAIGIWEGSHLAVITGSAADLVAKQLDEARVAVGKPLAASLPDGPSFSAAVLAETHGAGLVDAFARARRIALDLQLAGGNAVQIVDRAERPRRVLLAEDDTLTAALIVHRLEREGYEVEHHADGTSALEAVSEDRFGLVVLDVQMPGANGFDVLDRIRSQPSMNHVPIVMLTAVGGERDVVRGFELGADDYILKPFSPAELTARLKRFTRT